MKIGIMSMQRIENYGSFLQAYSLKDMLEELGHDVVFVDYVIEPCIVKEKIVVNNIPKHSYVYRVARKVYYIVKDFLSTISGKKRAREMYEASRLRNRYSEYVKELGVTEQRTENTPVDVLVIGSDEVFNCLQTNKAVGYSKQLFGENVNAKKVITYAACAGYTTEDGLIEYGIKEEVARMLKNNIKHFSVRDSNTFELVLHLTGITAELHLDPVLVSDFDKHIIDKNDISNYVVVYSYEERMSNNLDEIYAIQSFVHQKGLKTVSIGNYQEWTDLHIEASPFELLGYIKNADYVITDTFHGTVFSIIMEKQFATIVRESNKQKLSSLLEQFGLKNREVKDMKDLENIVTSLIDFSVARKVRQQERMRSLKYLKTSIED